jgi:hypothetical protein
MDETSLEKKKKKKKARQLGWEWTVRLASSTKAAKRLKKL